MKEVIYGSCSSCRTFYEPCDGCYYIFYVKIPKLIFLKFFDKIIYVRLRNKEI